VHFLRVTAGGEQGTGLRPDVEKLSVTSHQALRIGQVKILEMARMGVSEATSRLTLSSSGTIGRILGWEAVGRP
jgi:hypothetical protein